MSSKITIFKQATKRSLHDGICVGTAHRGFTIIELLAILGVLTVIAVMIIPARGGTRVRSHVVTCQDNLKRLAMGWKMYAEDHADVFVRPGDQSSNSWRIRPGLSAYSPPPPHPVPTNNAMAVAKFDSWGYVLGGLARYAPGTSIINCPGNPGIHRPLPTYNSYSGLDGLSGGASSTLRLYKSTQILHPAERFLWIEDGDQRLTSYGGFTFAETLGTWAIRSTPPNPEDGPTWGITNWWEAPASFHLNGANWIYADGHAEWRRWADLDTVRFAMDPVWGRAQSPSSLNMSNDILFVVERYPSALNP